MSEPLFVETDENPYVESILTAATELFSKKGYLGTSMRDLGDALGLHAGSLYVHIRSKEDVLFAIVNRISGIHERYMKEIQASGLSPIDQLREVARNNMRLIGENREAATVYFHDWKNLGAKRRQQTIAKRDAYEASLREIVQACIDDGTFRSLDVTLVSFAFVSMFNWSYQWYSPKGRFEPDEVGDSFFDFITRGLMRSGVPTNGAPARDGRRSRT